MAMNGHKIPNGEIAALPQPADWAPTHGYTEPWRFIVYENPQEFCKQHAGLYQQNYFGDRFDSSQYNKLLHQGDKVSCILSSR